MADPTLDRQAEGLSGPALMVALFAKYSSLLIYGIAAMVYEVPSFVLVGSSLFAATWATLVASFALSAALGVARTWVSGRYRLEKWTTAAFILTFTAYSFVLIWRSFTTGETGSLPLAILPISLCILPIVRYFDLVGRQFFAKRKATA